MALVIASVAAAGCAAVGFTMEEAPRVLFLIAAGAAVGMACAMQKMAETQAAESRASSNQMASMFIEQMRSKRGVEMAMAVPPPPQPAPPTLASDQDLHLSMGFTMEEARRVADLGQEQAVARTPQQVLAELQRGNARFWMGGATRPEKSAFERRALISKQFPLTAILGCSDSRVPTEIVFDQGLGDMFVVRVAGNCLEDATAASLQFAVKHLKVKVLVVMGHEGCGAVKAAGLPAEVLQNEPPALCKCLNKIKMGLDFKRLECIHDPRAHDREAVVTNVKRQVEALTEDESIMGAVRSGELLIIGAFYEISSGIVDFFFEVSEQASHTSRGVQSAFDPIRKMEIQSTPR
mmetsp:Transcript_21314/g.56423  ORF Transcript_21314/g.56423 Transcript_21314/m.56423 type:complete len:350 (-) Transcript_21314:284-1333(-)